MTNHTHIQQPAEITAVPAAALQRACACGASAGVSGKCSQCGANEKLGVQPKLTVNAPDDRYEQEADQIAERVVSGSSPAPEDPLSVSPLVQRQSDEEEEEETLQRKGNGSVAVGQQVGSPFAKTLGSAGPGRPLDAGTRNYFEPRLGHSLGAVRLHDDGKAAVMNRQINAHAFTHRNHIFFASGEYDARSKGGRKLLAHEITHTLQQTGGDGAIRRKTLADIDAKVRKNIQISRLAPPPSEVAKWSKEYFDPEGVTSRKTSATVEYGGNITDKVEKKGLESFVAELIAGSRVRITPATDDQPEQRTNTDPKKWPLPANHMLDLELDLTPYGHDHANFRFVRYTEGKAEKVLIEKKPVPTAVKPAAKNAAKAPAEKGPDAKPAAGKAAAKSYIGKVSIGSVNVEIDTSFGEKRGKVIADAVALLPSPIRAKVDNVKFDYVGSGQGPGGENGHYDQIKDTVKVWGDLFNASDRRIGTAEQSAYQVVHELGHVIDQRPLFKAQNARTEAQDRKKKLEKDLSRVDTNPKFSSDDPLAGMGDAENPKAKAEKDRIKKEIKKIEKEIDKLNKEVGAAKSIAGDEIGKDTASLKTEFGKALAADGVKAVTNAVKDNRKAAKQTPPGNPKDTLSGGVSNYAQVDLMEAFAENFSYYILDEDLLKALRPKTHAYFVKAYPKPTGAKP